MSKQLLVFIGLYGLALVGAFVFPPMGVWGFLFESNYHPPNQFWGGALAWIGDRWSFYIGVAMALAVLIHWGRYTRVAVFTHPQTLLLMLFTANAALVSTWAYSPDHSWKDATDYFKWFLVYVCIAKTHSDRRWMAAILYIYLFSSVHAGWDETFHHKGGRTVDQGPVTARGDNFVSAHTAALLPLAGYIAISPATNQWIRLALLGGIPLMLNVVAHASSRGAFLSLLATGLAALLVARGRIRWLTLAGIAVGALIGMRLFHEQFWNRMATINTYEEDGSAAGRLIAWEVAAKLSQAHPLGYGGEAFDKGLGAQHMPMGFHTTHNMFFEILVAWGWQGTFLFFAFILLTLRDSWRLQSRLGRTAQGLLSRQYLEALGIFVGLVGMLTAAMFLNRVRWELWWVFGAYVVCLKNAHAPALAARAGFAVSTAVQPLSRPFRSQPVYGRI